MKAKLRGTTGAYFDVVEVDAIHVKDSIPFVRYYADEEGTIHEDHTLEFLPEESKEKHEITLEDAVLHARHKARELGECECAKNHLQLAEWLEELQALRNLSKVKEETIEGWVAVDEYGMGGCFLHTQKPHPESREFCDTGDCEVEWVSDGQQYELDSKLFPDLTPESEPKKVRITITPIEE